MSDLPPITQKVGMNTTDFKAGITELNRSIRVIESGFRATAAGLGDWAKNSSGLEMRIKALNSQIEIQQKKVEATRKEYERIKKEKGENSRAAQELQIKLNKENETLGKMQTELRQTNTSLEGMGKEEKTTKDKTEDLDKAEDKAAKSTTHFGDTLKGLLGHLKNAASGMVTLIVHVAKLAAGLAVGVTAAALGAVAALGALVIKSGEWADQFATLAGQTRISTTRLQELDYIGKKLDVDLNTIATSQARMTRNMAGSIDGTGDAADAFKALGIKVTDANGNLRDSKVVFGEIIDALGKVKNPTESDAMAMAIFGKSAMELNPLIDAGAEKLAALAEEANKVGAVMSEKDVEALDKFKDSFDAFHNTMGGIIGTITAKLAPALSNIIEKINNFLASAAGKKIVEDLGNAFRIMGDSLTIIVNALGTNNPLEVIGSELDNLGKGNKIGILETIGKTLGGLQGTFDRMKSGFTSGGIGGMLKTLIPEGGVTGIIGSLAPTIGKMLSGMLTSFAAQPAKLLQIGLDIITGLADGLVAAIPALLPVFLKLITSLVNFITTTLPTLLQLGLTVLMSLAMGIMQAIPQLIPVVLQLVTMFINFLVTNLPMLITAAIQMIVTLATGIAQALPTLIPVILGIIPVVITTLLENLPLLAGAALQLIIALAEGLIAAIPVLLPEIPKIIVAIFDAIIASLPMISEAAVKLLGTLVKGIVDNLPMIADTAIKIISSLSDKLIELRSTILEFGKNIVTGIWEGIKANGEWFNEQITEFFTKIIDAVKKVLGIKSPSTIFMGMGENMALGLGEGFTGQFRNIQDQVNRAVEGLSSQASFSVSGGVSGFGRQLQPAGAPISITIQGVPDDEMKMRRLARYVVAEIQRKQS